MSRRRAFTLIEVMLTVAITVTVFAMIGGILMSVINTAENVGTQLRSEKAGYGILTTLQRDLTGVSAYALGGLAFRGKDETENGRDADQLDFVTTADVMRDENGQAPRLIEVGYKLAADPEAQIGTVLVLYRRTSAFSGDPLSSGTNYVELYGLVHAFNLEFLDDKDEWVKEWKDPEALPRAVKVHLELALDEGERELVERGLADIPNPVFEQVIRIPAAIGPTQEDPQPAPN